MSSIAELQPRVMRLHSMKFKPQAIATALGVPPSAVTRIIYETIGGVRLGAGKNSPHHGWTEERVQKLHDLWREGLSASRIASRLGGVTRNAVIGKVHREGLAGRATTDHVRLGRPVRSRKVSKKRAKPREVPPPFMLRDMDPGFVEPKTNDIATVSCVADLDRDHCRWPVGDPKGDFHGFCGADRFPGSSYCEHHAHRAKATPRQLATMASMNPASPLALGKIWNPKGLRQENAEDIPA